MGIRKIRWSRKATSSFLSILKWYQEERGKSFIVIQIQISTSLQFGQLK